MPRYSTPLAERFWSKVDKSGDCWTWTGAGRQSEYGYGRFSLNSKTNLAHRVAWMLTNGPIPAGMFVCHTCDNPPCVNPDHLFLGTTTDNMRDMGDKGRSSVQQGARTPTTKLTPDDVRTIRAKSVAGVSHASLGREYGVAACSITSIVHRRTWPHIE